MPKKEMKTGKCSCNLGLLVAAVAVMTLGLFALVQGFSLQAGSLGAWTTVLPWYFFGLLLMVVGKLLKKQSHVACPVHGNW